MKVADHRADRSTSLTVVAVIFGALVLAAIGSVNEGRSPHPIGPRAFSSVDPFSSTSYDSTGSSVAPPAVIDTLARTPSANESLTVHVTASAAVTDQYLPLLFNSTASGSGSIIYLWNFGDNQTSALADPSHAYASVGRQTIVLHVFGANGSWGEAWTNVTVNNPISLAPPTFPPTGGIGKAIEFGGTVAYGTPPYTYFWELGDHNISHVLNATHAYSRPGTYLATLWVNDSAGGQATFSEFVLIPYPNSTTSSTSGSNLGDWAYAGIGVGVVVIIAAAVVLVYNPRGKR